jgi:hypothetical protein
VGLDPAQIRFDQRLGGEPRIGFRNVEAGEYVAAKAFERAAAKNVTRGTDRSLISCCL